MELVQDPKGIPGGYRVGPLRDVLLPLLAGALTIVLSFEWILILFIVTGLAHFFMAAKYQYRAGKVDTRYVLLSLGLFFCAVLYFMLGLGLLPILFAVALFFSLHFAYDEFTLHSERAGKKEAVLIVGFSAFFLALVISFVYPDNSWSTLLAVGIASCLALFRFTLFRGAPTGAERYLWYIMAIVFVIAVFFHLPGRVLGTVVLLHVANWYVSYGTRLAGVPARAKKYWVEVVLTLALFAGLFLVHTQLHVEALKFLFGSVFYYAWAIWHVVLSFYSSSGVRKVA